MKFASIGLFPMLAGSARASTRPQREEVVMKPLLLAMSVGLLAAASYGQVFINAEGPYSGYRWAGTPGVPMEDRYSGNFATGNWPQNPNWEYGGFAFDQSSRALRMMQGCGSSYTSQPYVGWFMSYSEASSTLSFTVAQSGLYRVRGSLESTESEVAPSYWSTMRFESFNTVFFNWSRSTAGISSFDEVMSLDAGVYSLTINLDHPNAFSGWGGAFSRSDFRIEPVPEPSTLLTLGMLWAGSSRRRNRAQARKKAGEGLFEPDR